MNQSRLGIALATLVVVGFQLAVFTQWRVAGVVIMLVWLWPVAVGLTGITSLAVMTGFVTGLLFDAQCATPFGLNALVGALLGYVVARLGKEGVGDLDAAALWVTPAIAAVAGAAAPVLFVGAGVVALNFSLWRGGLVNSMLVNAVAFFVLARPLARLAGRLAAPALRGRR